jgi:signal peptidase I
VRLTVWISLSVVAFKVFLIPIKIQGHSMAPSFHDGTAHLIYRQAYRHKPPKRGDVVGIYDRDFGERALVLKRILALPGETVGIRKGVIYINSEPYSDKFTTSPIIRVDNRGHPSFEQLAESLLGEDIYFAAGDNRSVTMFYFVNVTNIVGKVLY